MGDLHAGARPEASRIIPEPPSPLAPGAESLHVWGFSDSGFEVNAAGQVWFRGSRYAISGKVIPSLLPWAEGVLGVKLDPFDRNTSHYPTAVPERHASPSFEAAVAARLSPPHVSSDPRVRVRHGHGHTQEDMWAIKHGALRRVPDLVVWPEDEAEVRGVLELAREHGACLVPYGGGGGERKAIASSKPPKAAPRRSRRAPPRK